MRKKLAIVVAGLAASVVSANAADLGRRVAPAPAPIPMAYNWSGFYFGGHAGAGWGDSDTASVAITGTGTTASSGSIGSTSDVGFVGGLQGGYNFQLAPNWVLGVEGDFTWSTLSSTQGAGLLTAGGASIPGTAVSFTRDINWMASARGRLGYTWDRVMVYGTGGAAWADYDNTGFVTLANGATASGSFGNTRSGWVAGGGVEWAMPSFWFAGDWTTRVEYLHYDFDSKNGSSSFGPGGAASFNFGDPTVDVVRVGLNYKFYQQR